MPKSCPVCGSRRWRKDGVTGNAVCEDGHVFQDFRSENLVMEPTGHVLQKRTLKKAPRRNRRKEGGDVNKDYYHGEDAEYLKLQAMQLLLRHQVQTISKMWSLPDIFEAIVRDLWAYQLAIVPLPPRPDPSSHPEIDNLLNIGDDKPDGKSDEKAGSEDEETDDEDNGPPSPGTTDSDEPQIDPDILAEISNTSVETNTPRTPTSGQRSDTKWRRKRRLRVSDTIAVLVIALWVLRVPVMNVKIESLINGNHLPYIDFGHSNLIPPEMRKHLNREVTLALSPSRAPRPIALHTLCHRFVRTLTRQFGLTIPEANIQPIAWRVVSQLGGTPTTHSQVTRLLSLININTSLVNNEIQVLTRKPRRGCPPRRRSYNLDTDEREERRQMIKYEKSLRYDDVWLPEVSIAAGWVMVMKMAYGLDADQRHALVKSDPIIGMPQPGKWVDELEKRLQSGVLKGTGVVVDKQDFAGMDLEDIDRYLDSFERVLLKDRDCVAEHIFELPASKPMPPKLPPPNSWADYHFHSSSLPIGPSTVSTAVPNKYLPLLPGEKYKSYDWTDVAGTLPPSYAVVLNAAAQIVGVDTNHLAKVVEVYERRLEKVRVERGVKSRSASRGRVTGASLQRRASERALNAG